MIEILAISALMAVIVLQQWSIQKLINKVMSRNFHEYETAVNLNKEQKHIKVDLGNEVPEDLGSLQELQPF